MAGEIDAFLYFGAAWQGMKAPKIEGETTDIVEKDTFGDYGRSMAIQSYQMGFTHETESTEETQTQGQKGSQAHHPEINDVSVTRLVDAASPNLLLALWNSARYEDAWIVQKKAGGSKGRSGAYFWEVRLREVSIKGLNWNADEGGATKETLTLNCKGVEVRYYKQKQTGELEQSYLGGNPLPEDLADLRPNKTKGDSKLDGSQIASIVQQVIKKIKDSNPQLHLK